ncbi:MAG: hypothetical protein EPO68_02790 [Planctomycetota bacterium]|nr:MAG: hypothetical protein EPO68_02790 [Planctomycetota bacterium]
MKLVRTSAAALLSVFLPSVLAAQDQAGAGFALNGLPYPGLAVTSTFANGDVLAFDGSSIARYSADGTLLVGYANFLVPVYPSFATLDATESYALVGESTNHSLARLDLATSTLVPLTTLVFNYDAVQRSGSNWVVSAATCGGISCGNKLYTLDALTGATVEEADLSGPSGPVAVDPAGNVYYANQAGASSLVRIFPAASFDAAPVLADADGVVIGVGYAGSSDLLFDAETGRLYMAENNYLTGSTRIRAVTASEANAPIVVDALPFGWITNLELRHGADAAVFAAYQPASGGRLLYNNTDFLSSWTRSEVTPLRPQLALSGPGASGAGALGLDVSGGVPGGVALFAAAPTASLLSVEAPFPLLSAVPLLSPLALAEVVVLPVINGLDGQGAASRVVPHQGDLLGVLTVQALLLAPDLTPSATTNAANL